MNKLISKSTKFNLITKISNNTIYKVANHIYNNNSSLDKIKIGGALGMIVTSKYLNVQVPIYLKEIVDNVNNNLISNENISNNFINNNIFNELNENTLYLIIGYGFIRSTSYGLHELRNIIFGNVSDNTVRNISKKTFLNILDRDIDFHQNKKIGGLTKTLDRGNKGMRYLFNSIVFNIFPLTLEIGFVTNILLNNYDNKFTYLTLGTIGIYSAYTITLTQWRSKFIKNKINYENECSANLTDSLINYDTIKYFNNEIYEANNYENAIKKFQDENLKVIKSLGLLNFGQNVIFSSSLSLSLYLCINQIYYGTMTIGDIVLMNSLLLQMMTPLNFLGSMYRDTNQALIDSRNLFSLIEDKKNKERKDYNKINKCSIFLKPKYEIIFDNVSFNYKNKQIFNNLSFGIEENISLAITGKSGIGKSTLFKLLYKFYKPTSGNIYINNQNLNSINSYLWRENLSIIQQDISLFNKDILYNLKYGLYDNELDFNEKLNEILNLLEIEYLFQNNISVGEKGQKLSGGEKQRLIIARSLLLNKPILLADEPFSALDNNIENKILNSNIFKNKTSIIITHNKNNLKYFTNILNL